MSEKTPDKIEPSDPINAETLDAERAELEKASVLSKGKKSLLCLCIILVIAALTWGILSYFFFIPKKNKEIKQDKHREEQAEQLKEQDKLVQIAKEKATKLKEDERLKRNSQNSIAAEVAIKDRDWVLAKKYLGELQNDQHDLSEISKIQSRIDQGKDDERKALLKVNTLLEQTKKLDTGVYSAEAIALLDEALTLYPKHPEATLLRKKINAYQSEFRIPEDFPTIAEVMPKLRAGDTILLGTGTFNFSAILTKPVTIKGAGIGKTIVKSDTTKQSAFVFLKDANAGDKTYKISDLTIKGTSYQDFNIDRFPLVLIKAEVTMNNTYIGMSSGHGIAVLSGALTISNSEITTNGWDGVSVRGIGAVANISKCKIHTNYDHGIDYWQDASGTISETEVYENTGSGIVVMGKKAAVKITQVRSYKNEQCGIVTMDGGSIVLARVVAAGNVLSGVAVHGENSKANFGMVISNNNKEAGYYLDPASTVIGYERTTSEGNAKGNVVRKAFKYTIERQVQ